MSGFYRDAEKAGGFYPDFAFSAKKAGLRFAQMPPMGEAPRLALPRLSGWFYPPGLSEEFPPIACRTMPFGPSADARHQPAHPAFVGLWSVLCGLLASQTGCTALLTASALRDAVHESADPEAIVENRDLTNDVAIGAAGPTDDADDARDATGPVLVKPGQSADEALEDAIARLADAGRFDDATEAALLGMLEQAPKQDWPEIIDAFVDTLETSRVAAKPVTAPQQPDPAAALKPSIGPAVEPPPPAGEPSDAAAPPSSQQTPPAVASPSASPIESLVFPVGPAAAAEPIAPATTTNTTPTLPAVAFLEPAAPDQPEFTVANACFATRVRGWGLVDRFETTRFGPGQDVIVYFELEHLEDRESAEGHATRIDTVLALVADDGRMLHQWTFEPVEETCPARRRDYFARYVVRIPERVPVGMCRLEISVTDQIGERTAQASLPLEISSR